MSEPLSSLRVIARTLFAKAQHLLAVRGHACRGFCQLQPIEHRWQCIVQVHAEAKSSCQVVQSAHMLPGTACWQCMRTAFAEQMHGMPDMLPCTICSESFHGEHRHCAGLQDVPSSTLQLTGVLGLAAVLYGLYALRSGFKRDPPGGRSTPAPRQSGQAGQSLPAGESYALIPASSLLLCPDLW